jgi:hypothetical protein
MSTTELDEVQALLEHVLPDPSGYAQRLLMQAMTRWGQAATTRANPFYPPAHSDQADSDVVIEASPPPNDEPPIDISMLLAAALGACECWGLAADCELCRGRGSAGWAVPDPELFAEFVEPAISRLLTAPSATTEPAFAGANGSATATTA